MTSTVRDPVHTYVTGGILAVALTVTDPCGDREVATGVVTVTCQPLLAAFTPSALEVALGTPLTFTNESTGSTPLAYLWDFADGTTSTVTHPVHLYTATGTYSVTLTVTDPCAAEQRATVEVRVRPIRYTIYMPLIFKSGQRQVFIATFERHLR